MSLADGKPLMTAHEVLRVHRNSFYRSGRRLNPLHLLGRHVLSVPVTAPAADKGDAGIRIDREAAARLRVKWTGLEYKMKKFGIAGPTYWKDFAGVCFNVTQLFQLLSSWHPSH